MADKTIVELQLASEFTDAMNLPVDNGIQTYRTTGPQLKTYATKIASAAKTANYNVLAADQLLTGDSSGGAFTFTLPDVAENTGKRLIFKKISTDFTPITIDGDGADVDGGATTTLNTEGETLEIVSDGVEWLRVNRHIPSVWTAFTMNVRGTTTDPTKATTPDRDFARWRRVGDSIEIYYDYTQSSLTGANDGVGLYIFDLPGAGDIEIDPAKAYDSSLASNGIVGPASSTFNGSTPTYLGQAVIYDEFGVSLKLVDVTSGSGGTFDVGESTGSGFAQSNDVRYGFSYKVPILGWVG